MDQREHGEQTQRPGLWETADGLMGQMLAVLGEMEELARRSTQDDCSPRERVLLQRDLELYRKRLDRLADRLHALLPEVELDELP